MVFKLHNHIKNRFISSPRSWWFGIRWIILFVILFFFWAIQIYAAVTTTPATGGTNISADLAGNATTSGWTTLGIITIAEWANTDFSVWTNVTLILTPPSNRRFRTNTGTVTYTNGRNISAASISSLSTGLIVTLTVWATNKSDTLYISGIQIQAITWSVGIGSTGNIIRPCANSWTAVIAGITCNSTNFGTLGQIPGTGKYLDLVLPWQTFVINSWHNGTCTPQNRFTPIPFTGYAFDQFRNIITSYTWLKAVYFSWPWWSYPSSLTYINGVATGTFSITWGEMWRINIPFFATGTALSSVLMNALNLTWQPPTATLISPLSWSFFSWYQVFSRTWWDNNVISWYQFSIYSTWWTYITGKLFTTSATEMSYSWNFVPEWTYLWNTVVYDTLGLTWGTSQWLFYVDTTFPTFSWFISWYNYNTGVMIYFSDNNSWYSATLNGAPYTNGTLITEANTYTFVVTDIVGNTTSATFTISYVGVTFLTWSLLNISADKAANSTSWSAYSTLSNILITEWANGNFTPGTGVTLILTAPANRRFRPGSWGITYKWWTADIKSGSLNVTESTIIVTLDIVSAISGDAISITDLQIQAISGNIIPSSGVLLRTCANPWTATIYGVSCDSTPFFTFSQTVGTSVYLITTLPGQTFIDGLGNSGNALTQTAGVSFDIVKLTAVDQFMHIVPSYWWNKTISYSWTIDGTYTTGVSFSNGQSTTTLTTNLIYQQTSVSITATDGVLSGIASSLFDVIDVVSPALTAVHIQSDNSYSWSLAKAGDIITITFTGNKILTWVSVTVASGATSVTNLWGNFWKAEYTVATGSISWTVSFLISFFDLNGTTWTATLTTDDSTVSIDVLSPSATVAYVPLSWAWTSGNIVATITWYEEPIVVMNTTWGSLSYTFTTTGSFTFQFRDLAGNTWSVWATVRWIDRESPVVTINGWINATFYIGESYVDTGTDPWATWIDNVDGSWFIARFTSWSNSSWLLISWGDYSFSSTTWIYYLEYGYTDSAGNYWFAIRTVTIKEDSGLSLNVLGANPYYIEFGSWYTELWARRFDAVDGTWMVPETGIVSTVNTGEIGSYTVTYTRVSSRWMTWVVVRDVIVQDTILPTATISYDITWWTFTDVVATLTGFSESVTWLNTTGHTFTGNGQFVFTFYDLAGNTWYATGNVTWIDKISPTFSGIVSWSTYDTWVIINFSDNVTWVTATLNGNDYTSGTPIVIDGSYVFVVTDIAWNSTWASFVVSNIPVLTSVHIASTNIHPWYATTGDLILLSFTWSQALSGVSSTINGNPATISWSDLYWVWSYVLSWSDSEGIVFFTIDYRDLFAITWMQVTWTTDASSVIFDKTPPIFSGVTSGERYNTWVMIYFSDTNSWYSATLNGSPYTSGTLITGENTYTFVATDMAGNTTGATFTISYAVVSITPADGVNAFVSADKAANALGGGSYSTLSDIIINEWAPNNFHEGTGTLILTAPDNWKFNSWVGNISCQLGSRNIKSCSVTVTDSTITATFFVSWSDLYDATSIYNIQVQPISGQYINTTGIIYRTCANPWTADILGIMCDATNFWSFSIQPGSPRNLILTMPGQTFVNGVGNSWSALNQTAGVSFDLVKLIAVDQFIDIVPSYTGSKTISYSGIVWTFTTGVTFVTGQSTTVLTTTFSYWANNITLTATDGTLTGLASSSFNISDTTSPTATVIYDITWWTNTDVHAIATWFSQPISRINSTGYTFTSNGTFVFEFSDLVGNTWYATGIVDRIDKVMPTFSGVTSGTTYTWSVSIAFSDNTTWFSATLNGSWYISGTIISADGTYVFVVTDIAWNSIGAIFTIDTADHIPPTLTSVHINSNNAYSGYAKVGDIVTITFVGNEALTGITVIIAWSNEAYTGWWTNRNVAYTMLSEDPEWLVDFSIHYHDLAWNTWSDVTGTTDTSLVIFDTTPPILSWVTSGTTYTTWVTITFNDNNTWVTATLNGSGYTSGMPITGSGIYTFVVTDIAGNSTGVIFTIDIDYTPPTATIIYDITWWTNTDVLATITGFSEPITWLNATGYLFTWNGIFTFIFYDLANNTGYATWEVTWIDKIFPTFTGVISGMTYTTWVTIAFSDNTTWVTATLNGSGYMSGTLIAKNGNYTFIVTDLVGNSTGVTFTINIPDTTPPVLAEVTPVPALTNDTTPNYTFSSNEAGTITYSWDCFSTTTVAVSGNTTITFSGLSEWLHTNCKIQVTDSSSNPSNRLSVTSFTVDITPPTATIIYDITWRTKTDVWTTITGFSDAITGLNATGHFFTGNDTFIFTFYDLANNTWYATGTVNRIDKESPIVTLNGSVNMSVLQSGSYTELWAIWTDNFDGSWVIAWPTTGSVDVYTLWLYVLLYSYIDTVGNSWSATRNVTVTWSAIPIININGANPYYIEYGSGYDEYGAERVDATDGNGTVTDISWNVITGILWTGYTVMYTYVNTLWYTWTNTRNVIVRDTTAPIITLNGSWTISVEYGSTYTELWATWTDLYEGNWTVSDISGSVNTSITGNYILTYSKTDSSGNTGTTTRTVTVQDPVPPIVTDVTWFALSATTAEIDFATNVAATGYIYYGIGSLTSLATWPTTTSHAIALSGLIHNSTYLYRAFARTNFYTGEMSATWTFTTPLLVTTYNVFWTLTVTWSVTIDDATSAWATFTATGALVITNGLHELELALSGLTISSVGWNKILSAPQDQSGVAQFGESWIPIHTQTSGTVTTTRTIFGTVKVGGNVGLDPNTGNYFRVKLYIPSWTVGKALALYRSDDWDVREISSPDATCTLDSSLICSFLTDHLSYFAPIGESTSTTTSSSGWTSQLKKDVCPWWDLSLSYYDGICAAVHGAATIWPEEFIQAYIYAHQFGITSLPTIDEADMEWTLVRSHMAKMMVNYVVNVLHQKTMNTWTICTFDDISNESSEMQSYIKLSCQFGLMGIGTTHFDPRWKVTRAQFGTVLSRAIRWDIYNNGDPFYLKHLNALQSHNIITNTNPSLKELRGYVMLMLMRTSENYR